MQIKWKKITALLAAAALITGISPRKALAVSGETVVPERSFDPAIFEVLLAEADENGDGALNEYELSGVTALDISGTGAESLRGLHKLPNLGWLDASDNKIRQIGTMLGCDSLTWADLSGNQLTSVGGIGSLSGVEELDLSDNLFSSASSFKNMKSLKYLNLSGNRITSSSSFAEGRAPLTELNLDGNGLREVNDLPDTLVILSARNNRLTDFRMLSFTTSLEELDLSGNSIGELPKMRYLKGLKACYLHDNQISGWVDDFSQSGCFFGLSGNRVDTMSAEGKKLLNALTENGNSLQILPQKLAGWQTDGTDTYYFYDEEGSFAAGTVTIDGKSYTFNEAGVLNGGEVTKPEEKPEEKPQNSGWITENGGKYYKNEDGSLLKGWQTVGGERYYFDEKTGRMATGWLTLGGIRYYLDEDGTVAVGTRVIDGKTYEFDMDGSLKKAPEEKPVLKVPEGGGWKNENGTVTYTENGSLKKGWLLYEKSWYYFDPADGRLKTGWQTIDGKKYYLNPSTGKMTNGWLKLQDDWYFFHSSGAMQTGWYKVNGAWYMADETGAILSSEWYEEKGNRYYLRDFGGAAVNWYEIDGKWYHFNGGNAMEKNKWIPTHTGNSWCYLGADGVMQTGWITVNGQKYYLRSADGYCLVNGWFKIDGKSYYFNKSGQVALNTTVGGYEVGPDGAWIQ